jgi:hypothetical protein
LTKPDVNVIVMFISGVDLVAWMMKNVDVEDQGTCEMLQYIVSLYILFLTSFLHIFLWIINSYLALVIYYTIRQWQCLEISCIVDNKRNFKENNDMKYTFDKARCECYCNVYFRCRFGGLDDEKCGC